ncbi:hypothetical protein NDU88_003381 [Pleurodeles waltl]|uniref:Uncharacterized protein n=1 Tax=Pleurodeles waltl TaxID=8319 RepID=A0AAV7LF44_PLEWA|nr:hypothetical protein NDU88_003381 [Pleurodeles waltl]
MINYIHTLQFINIIEKEGEGHLMVHSGEVAELSLTLVDLMAATQGLQVEVISKIDVVAIDVNLLQADLQKATDRVAAMKQNVNTLQQKFHSLRYTVFNLQKQPTWMNV